jgi:hypothetical protein
MLALSEQWERDRAKQNRTPKVGKKLRDPIFTVHKADGTLDPEGTERGKILLQQLEREGFGHIEDEHGNVIRQIVGFYDEKTQYYQEFTAKFHAERERREKQGNPFTLLENAIGYMVIEGKTTTEMTEACASICNGLSESLRERNKILSRATVARIVNNLHNACEVKHKYRHNR